MRDLLATKEHQARGQVINMGMRLTWVLGPGDGLREVAWTETHMRGSRRVRKTSHSPGNSENRRENNTSNTKSGERKKYACVIHQLVGSANNLGGTEQKAAGVGGERGDGVSSFGYRLTMR